MLTLITVSEGTDVTLTAAFTLADGTATDPTAVTLTLAQGAVGFSSTTYTYGVGSEITRTGVGVYEAVIATAGLPGTWVGQWAGTGACQVAEPFQFLVIPLPL